MLGNYKGRQIEEGTLVRVYRNLNCGLWSVLAMEGRYRGLVIGHFEHLRLLPHESRPLVAILPSAQRRAKMEGVRNVHLFIQGNIYCHDVEDDDRALPTVTYVPFRDSTLVMGHNNDQALETERVREVLFVHPKAHVRLAGSEY